MSASFDPYHQWLAIPPKYQPPDHYRLLGVEPFEDDLDVIGDAAERQIAHVRRKALSQYQQQSQKILNELAGARACLSDPAKKAAYDKALQTRLAAAAEPAKSETPVVRGSPGASETAVGDSAPNVATRRLPPQIQKPLQPATCDLRPAAASRSVPAPHGRNENRPATSALPLTDSAA